MPPEKEKTQTISYQLDYQLVGQEIRMKFRQCEQEMFCWIVDAQDEAIRESLIKLGWTPPSDDEGRGGRGGYPNTIVRRRVKFLEQSVDFWTRELAQEGDTMARTALNFVRFLLAEESDLLNKLRQIGTVAFRRSPRFDAVPALDTEKDKS